MRQRRLILIVAPISLVIGLLVGGYIGISRGIPFAETVGQWSIGIYEGQSPLNLAPSPRVTNPVLTASDVTDVPADFVADPFMVKEDTGWYMFFEVLNSQTDQGDIGLATSQDGLNWEYQQIVLDEVFHLSYPYVFKHEGEYYMIPESSSVYSVRLYKAKDFPTQWSFVSVLLTGAYFDSTVFQKDGLCWMFTSDRNDVLRLFYADILTGPWMEHPHSPLIVGDANIARPGGRIIIFDGRLIRFAQDDDPTYGNAVRAFEITTLTTVNYEEKEITEMAPLEASGNDWNALGMHNLDPYQISENEWLACVDGYREVIIFGFEY